MNFSPFFVFYCFIAFISSHASYFLFIDMVLKLVRVKEVIQPRQNISVVIFLVKNYHLLPDLNYFLTYKPLILCCVILICMPLG